MLPISDIHCACCGMNTDSENQDEYTHWFSYLFYWKVITRRRSDESYIKYLSFFCCFPLFYMSKHYERRNEFKKEITHCCMVPCCIDCVETPTSYHCDCTTLCCKPIRCLYYDYSDDTSCVEDGEDKCYDGVYCDQNL